MAKTIATITAGGLDSVVEQAKEYVTRSKAANTLRAYQSDWRDFGNWCNDQGAQALPAAPEVVAFYLTFLAGQGIKSSTIQRRVSAISQAHQAAGEENPTRHQAVRAVMAGIRRVHGTNQEGKAPALTEDIRAMVDTLPDTLLGLRDKALLLIGFAGAFRRSELVGLDVENVQQTKQGLVIMLHRSKSDQEGTGRKVGIPYCPVPGSLAP